MKWTPDPDFIRTTNLWRAMQEAGFGRYEDFYDWSVTEREKFWDFTVRQLSIRFKRPYDRVLDLSGGPEAPYWLPGAKMNIIDSVLTAPPEKTAIRHASERDPQIREITYGELSRRIDDVLHSLREAGLKEGDFVGIDMPMTPEAVIIYLAALKGGMPVITVADSFSPREINIRFGIAPPKIVFTQDFIHRGGKILPLYEKLKQAGAPQTVVIRTVQDGPALREGDRNWDDFLVSAPQPLESTAADPMDTITVLFSSGTTSEPKAIPWNHTTAIKSAADAYYHHDIRAGDTVAWPTNLGWMMGPWLIFASFINNATMALFDGLPTGEDFARFVQEAGVTMLGTVPGIVRGWKKNEKVRQYDWSGIKCFSSTGETSHPDDMAWLMEFAGGKPVIEYCGGTEIGGGYVTSTLIQPNYPSTFSTPALGSEFVILDENFRETDAGEVFLIPPSMGLSVKLLNKDHHAVYYAGLPKYKGKTLRRHGDYLVRLPDGYYRVMGRTDDSMNIGGIKVGAGQIEEVINAFDEVKESAAIAVTPPEGGPSELVIFAVVREGDENEWHRKFQQAIREKLNPLFKISRVILTDKLPRTASGKIMRRILRGRVT
ncbi:MAG: AMP-binding protein [Chlorobi bacterium]|nr:AMP-binding protein [Chlorobiota bacterium]